LQETATRRLLRQVLQEGYQQQHVQLVLVNAVPLPQDALLLVLLVS
jgi:hypothetical protein